MRRRSLLTVVGSMLVPRALTCVFARCAANSDDEITREGDVREEAVGGGQESRGEDDVTSPTALADGAMQFGCEE